MCTSDNQRYSRIVGIPIPASPALVEPQLPRRLVEIKLCLAHVTLDARGRVGARVLYGPVEEVVELVA